MILFIIFSSLSLITIILFIIFKKKKNLNKVFFGLNVLNFSAIAFLGILALVANSEFKNEEVKTRLTTEKLNIIVSREKELIDEEEFKASAQIFNEKLKLNQDARNNDFINWYMPNAYNEVSYIIYK